MALLVKELIWRYLIQLKPTKRPIFLYASRRSGSTLLMEVICANRGVMFSDQPFGLYTASSATINRLPVFPGGQVVSPDPEEQACARVIHSEAARWRSQGQCTMEDLECLFVICEMIRSV